MLQDMEHGDSVQSKAGVLVPPFSQAPTKYIVSRVFAMSAAHSLGSTPIASYPTAVAASTNSPVADPTSSSTPSGAQVSIHASLCFASWTHCFRRLRRSPKYDVSKISGLNSSTRGGGQVANNSQAVA